MRVAMPLQGGSFISMVNMQFLQDVVHVILDGGNFNVEGKSYILV